jgi:hypothetical protein
LDAADAERRLRLIQERARVSGQLYSTIPA